MKLISILLVVLVSFFAVSCNTNTSVTPVNPDELLLQQFRASIIEASKPLTKSGIDTTLTPIIKSNSDLQWDSESRVLLVSWTNTSYFDDKVDSTILTASDMWVTAVPVAKVLMGHFVNETTNPELRMKQVLGMWPDKPRSRFVEVWADTNNLFRPCPDPEIWDCQCDTVYKPNVTNEHRQWFENEIINKYGSNGYPWTRQGYTYDWGGKTKFGVSEFVIKKSTPVKIKSVTSPSTVYTMYK
ncbi:MAG: hypothetical protein NTY74_02015 [Ignavibacteriae bacterium]|nr:hypothetical protein [Ignavibacteriota bacterium]